MSTDTNEWTKRLKNLSWIIGGAVCLSYVPATPTQISRILTVLSETSPNCKVQAYIMRQLVLWVQDA